jgi:hypothetical protein
MDKDQVKSKSGDLPGTSRDPTGRVISDKDRKGQDKSQDKSQDNRGNKGPPSSGSDQHSPRSDQQRRS